MTLQWMLDAQRALQINTYGIDPPTLDGDERVEFIRWNVLALEDELHEALGEVGWKPWATSRHLNRESYVGELVDAWHFLMNLLLVAGVTEEEFVARYDAKRRRNAERQVEGYDGVADKCPKCWRALDDKHTGCKLGVQRGGKPYNWCSVHGSWR